MTVPPGGTTWATWRRTGPAVRMAAAARPGALLVVAVATVVQGALPVATAWCTKVLLDDIVQPGPGPARWALAGLLAAALLMMLLAQVRQFSQNELKRGLEVLVQTRLAEAVNRLPGIAQFEQPAFHDQLRLASQAAQSAPGQVVQSGFGLVQGIITLVGFLSTLVVLDVRLAGLAVLAGAPGLAAEFQLSRRRAGLLWWLSPGRRRAAVYAGLQSDEHAAKEIRAFGLGTFFVDRLRRLLTTANQQERRLELRQLLVQVGLALAGVVVLAAGMFLIVHDALTGALMVGATAMAIAAFTGAQAGTNVLVREAAQTHQALLLLGHYDDVLAATGGGAAGARSAPPLRSGLALRDVWFRYGDDAAWALRGVDLDLPTGATVALVGSNGAGKSTLVKLICRLYEPERGSIHWDGVELREFDPTALRQRISVVFQDFVPWELTAAENIGIGDLALLTNRERIESAATRSGVHEPIMSLRDGYDTLLSRSLFVDDQPDDSRGGTNLSGGQWQRVAIARALLRDSCDLLILDEPSSGLDAEAEYRLHRELRRLRAGRTTLIISHRLRTARQADLILVLEAGSIVERGTHDELMARGGRYADLFHMQADGYALDTTPSAAAPA